jgi:hypothetical protein
VASGLPTSAPAAPGSFDWMSRRVVKPDWAGWVPVCAGSGSRGRTRSRRGSEPAAPRDGILPAACLVAPAMSSCGGYFLTAGFAAGFGAGFAAFSVTFSVTACLAITSDWTLA